MSDAETETRPGCHDCTFSRRQVVPGLTGAVRSLQCHRFPPRVDGWPLMLDADWCGEYHWNGKGRRDV